MLGFGLDIPTRALARKQGASVNLYGDDFVMVVETTSAGETFKIPAGSGTYNAAVDWGDGSTSAITASNDPDLTHSYANAGLHTIRVSGTFPYLSFAGGGDRLKLRHVLQLGNVGWENLRKAFNGCSAMETFSSGVCDVSGVADWTSWMNGTPGLTALDLSTLNAVSATSLVASFYNCGAPVIDVSGYDTSAVGTMNTMFRFTVGDIVGVETFNIEGINTSSGLTYFVLNNGLSTAVYDQLLVNWAAQSPISGLSPHFGSAKYTPGGAAEAARTALIGTHGWSISDGGPA